MLNCESDQLIMRVWDDLGRVATPELIRSAMGVDAEPHQCVKLVMAFMANVAGDLGETGDASSLAPGVLRMVGVLALVGICRMLEEREEIEVLEGR